MTRAAADSSRQAEAQAFTRWRELSSIRGMSCRATRQLEEVVLESGLDLIVEFEALSEGKHLSPRSSSIRSRTTSSLRSAAIPRATPAREMKMCRTRAARSSTQFEDEGQLTPACPSSAATVYPSCRARRRRSAPSVPRSSTPRAASSSTTSEQGLPHAARHVRSGHRLCRLHSEDLTDERGLNFGAAATGPARALPPTPSDRGAAAQVRLF